MMSTKITGSCCALLLALFTLGGCVDADTAPTPDPLDVTADEPGADQPAPQITSDADYAAMWGD